MTVHAPAKHCFVHDAPPEAHCLGRFGGCACENQWLEQYVRALDICDDSNEVAERRGKGNYYNVIFFEFVPSWIERGRPSRR